jgi:hypothetical protein
MMRITDHIADLRRRFDAAPTDATVIKEAAEAVEHLQCDVNRVLTWLRSGHLHEAAAYAHDAGNLARCVVDLQSDTAFMEAVPGASSLPDRTGIEPLVMAPVEAGRNESDVDLWIGACVVQAHLEERLSALTALKIAQPREAIWSDLATPLTDSAVSQLDGRLQEVLEQDDAGQLNDMQSHLVALGLATEGRGAKAIHKIEARLRTLQTAETAEQAADLAMQLHLAWAAMDAEGAMQLHEQWRSLLEQDEVGAASKAIAAPVLGWLDARQLRDAARHKSQALVDDLERGLDENAELPDLERRYATLQRKEIAVPGRITTRLAHRLAEQRAARRRRWTVSMGAVAGLAAIVIVAILVADRARRQELLSSNVEQAINRQLEVDDPSGAQQTLQDALAAAHIDSTIGDALGARIARAHDAWADRFNAAREHLAQAESLLEQPDSEATFEGIDNAIRKAKDVKPANADLELDGVLDRLRTRRIAWEKVQREVLRPRLVALDSIIGTAPPAAHDQSAWSARRDTMAEALAELALIATEPIAAQADLQSDLQRRRISIQALRDEADEIVTGLSEAQGLWTALQSPPATESVWVDTWEPLIESHGQLMQRAQPLKTWHAGLRDARAALAVQHWREQVLPELIVAGLIGGGAAGDTGTARDRLLEHLETSKAHTTPYAAIAKQLLAVTGGDDPNEAALRVLEESGLADLYRLPLSNGGVMYRRGAGGAEADTARAIVGTKDLSVPAGELVEAVLPGNVAPAGSLMSIGSSIALGTAIEAMQHGESAPTAIMSLLDAVESADPGDGVVDAQIRYVAMKALAIWLGPTTSHEGLDQWIQQANRAESPLRENWPRLSLRGTKSQRREMLRGLGRLLATAPSSTALDQLVKAPEQQRAAATRAAAPAAVLLYRNGRWMVEGPLPADPYLVRVQPGRGSTFIRLTVKSDGTVLPPPDLPAVPALVFRRGPAPNTGS